MHNVECVASIDKPTDNYYLTLESPSALENISCVHPPAYCFGFQTSKSVVIFVAKNKTKQNVY